MVAYFYVTRVHVTQITVRPGSYCWNNHIPVTSSSNILQCVCVNIYDHTSDHAQGTADLQTDAIT